MAWLRLDDGFDNDPAILAIARNRAEADRIVGVLTTLMLYCARHGTDGFVPELIVREHVRSRKLLERLTDPPEGGVALLHTRESKCECMADREWRGGATFYVHHYLQSNPTKDETDVARAKAAELRDSELLAAIRRRDLDRCRYCGRACNMHDRRSGGGLVADHVDPAVANGALNLVVACRGCNSRKGKRTPEAAGMSLRPVPDPTTDQPADQAMNQQKTNRSTTGQTTSAPVRDGTGRVNDPRPPFDDRPDIGSAGPDGERPPTGPPTGPPRQSRHPDPYRRRPGPDPQHNAGLPEEEP